MLSIDQKGPASLILHPDKNEQLQNKSKQQCIAGITLSKGSETV